MSRRLKFRLLALSLLLWQVSLGLMLPMSAVHAQTTHASNAAAATVPAEPVPCHGEGAAEQHHEPATTGPPCCQSHSCQGDCFVMPAMPAAIAVIAVTFRIEESIAVLRAGMLAPPIVEFFRPPI
ncbi:MAG: CopL family metal-binding regulatory protein [Steroidobacteraceae bacterium]